MLEEKEADARMRTYTGPMGKLITVMLCLWTAFQLYFTTIGSISAINLRAFHCIFLLVFTFLLFPTYKREKRVRRLPPVWDVACILLSIGAFGYLIVNYSQIAATGGGSASRSSGSQRQVCCWSLKRPGGPRGT